MTFIYGIIIFFLCVGFGLIIFSVFRKEEKTDYDFFQAENTLSLVNEAIEEVDNAIEHLNKLSLDVFKEFDEKYQELLFLYQLLEEKKSGVGKSYDVLPSDLAYEVGEAGVVLKAPEMPEEQEFKPSQTVYYNNPRLAEIQSLRNSGFSISEISKKLRMGQGEVKLIIELGNFGDADLS